jgi:hypothetical protein
MDYQRLERIRAIMRLQNPTYNLTAQDLSWLVETITDLNYALREVRAVIKDAEMRMDADLRMW